MRRGGPGADGRCRAVIGCGLTPRGAPGARPGGIVMSTRQRACRTLVALGTAGAAVTGPGLAAPAAGAAGAPLITVTVSARSAAVTGRLTQPSGPVRIALRAV